MRLSAEKKNKALLMPLEKRVQYKPLLLHYVLLFAPLLIAFIILDHIYLRGLEDIGAVYWIMAIFAAFSLWLVMRVYDPGAESQFTPGISFLLTITFFFISLFLISFVAGAAFPKVARLVLKFNFLFLLLVTSNIFLGFKFKKLHAAIPTRHIVHRLTLLGFVVSIPYLLIYYYLTLGLDASVFRIVSSLLSTAGIVFVIYLFCIGVIMPLIVSEMGLAISIIINHLKYVVKTGQLTAGLGQQYGQFCDPIISQRVPPQKANFWSIILYFAQVYVVSKLFIITLSIFAHYVGLVELQMFSVHVSWLNLELKGPFAILFVSGVWVGWKYTKLAGKAPSTFEMFKLLTGSFMVTAFLEATFLYFQAQYDGALMRQIHHIIAIGDLATFVIFQGIILLFIHLWFVLLGMKYGVFQYQKRHAVVR